MENVHISLFRQIIGKLPPFRKGKTHLIGAMLTAPYTWEGNQNTPTHNTPLGHKYFKLQEYKKPKVLFLGLVTSLKFTAPLLGCYVSLISNQALEFLLSNTLMCELPVHANIILFAFLLFLCPLSILSCRVPVTGPKRVKRKRFFPSPTYITSSKKHLYYTWGVY